VLRGEKHRVDVDVHQPAPAFLGLVDHGAAATDADVVVEVVEPAVAVHRGFDHRRAVGRARHVGLEGEPLTAARLDHLDRTLGQREVAIDHDYARAGSREQDRGGATVADAVAGGAAAGDDRDLVFESPAIRYVEAHLCVRHVLLDSESRLGRRGPQPRDGLQRELGPSTLRWSGF